MQTKTNPLDATPPPPATSPTSATITPRTPAEQEDILQLASARARRSARSTACVPIAGAARQVMAGVPRRPGLTPERIAEIEAEQAVRDRAERVAECRRRCRVPEKYRGLDLSRFDHIPDDARTGYERAATSLRKLIDRPAIVAMIGPPGTGKTSMAWALAQAHTTLGFSAMYLKAAEYIGLVRASWRGRDGPTELQVKADHVRPRLLVLDEMQVRGETPSEDITLLQLIDKRYDEGRATLLISNHSTRAELKDRLDDRLWSRMKDGGGIIACDWADMRGRTSK